MAGTMQQHPSWPKGRGSSTTISRKILIAVDFGTTFSGVAWLQTRNPRETHVVDTWPSRSYTDAKVPTLLAYDSNDLAEYRWGCQVDDTEPRHEWFKLKIDPTRQGGNSQLASNFPSSMLEPSIYRSANLERLVTDYLSALRKHLDDLLDRKLLPLAAEAPREYILTVPAVWSQKARDDTLTYAQNAGMGTKDRIHLITEPEAAALCDLSSRDRDRSLQQGDVFIVCDAGGGTVDLISYLIESVSPVKLKEATPGSGKTCGSIFLNRIFERRLREKLGFRSGWDEDGVVAAIQTFERSVKRNFQKDVRGPFLFRIPGLQPLPGERTNLRGRIHFSRDEMTNDVFEPVVVEIIALVQDQIQRVQLNDRQTTKKVLMVGGFGQNGYLRERLEDVVDPSIAVKESMKPQTAVVEGALLRLLAESSQGANTPQITSRVARKHCGTLVSEEYKSGVHDENRRDPNNYFESGYQVKTIDWFMRKGDTIKESDPVKYVHFWEKPVSGGRPTMVKTEVFECAEDNPPMYPTAAAHHIAEVKADFSGIPEADFNRVLGPNNQWYYQIWFEIEMTCYSAKRRFVLIYQDIRYHTVEVDYLQPTDI